MPRLLELDWEPMSPGSSSTAQTQCVIHGDIPALLAPTPVYAEGALRPWEMEVWAPSITWVT